MSPFSSEFKQRLSLFSKPKQADLLCCNLRGIERETLRVTPEGAISQRSHPKMLGSTLTHPQITTDYSEALLEFITDPFPRINDVLEQLHNTHVFTARNLEADEVLWATSMPCRLGEDSNIPIAQYGSANSGRMKSIYRRGLGLRYGRKMQAIAGIHFNFSVPDAVWSLLRNQDQSHICLQDYKTEGYMGLTRNFRRWFWILLYLMGASPALSRCFVDGRDHQLQPLGDDDLYLPHATSLRMGSLGYQSSAQDDLYVCYDSVQSYINSLKRALMEEYPPYSKLGLQDKQGEYHQLSGSVLQIENEFYSTIRPKQTTRSGETQLKALSERGIEYIEVRCVDINPFSALGITEEQIDFLELFLLTCLFEHSPETNQNEYDEILANQRLVVNRGREPGLTLTDQGSSRTLQAWAQDILEHMRPVAQIMDQMAGSSRYHDCLSAADSLIRDPDKTPSAILLREIQESGLNFIDWTLQRSNQFHQQLINSNCTEEVENRFQQMATESIASQKTLEDQQSEPLEHYLKGYFDQYRSL